MKTIIETLIDKSKWQEGPWQQEPDKKQWLDEETGYPCLIVRQIKMGHLCGYVGVPVGHPWYGTEPEANVHGCVTYGSKCQDNICHAVEDGEDDNVWWVGFDASHWNDRTSLTDVYAKIFKSNGLEYNGLGTYKDFSYMENECQSLAKQAKEAYENQRTTHSPGVPELPS